MKKIVPVKLICCIAFGSVSSACYLLRSIAILYIYIYIYIYIYMSIYLHFTSRKIIDKKTDIQNYTIARYQYTGKYLGVYNN